MTDPSSTGARPAAEGRPALDRPPTTAGPPPATPEVPDPPPADPPSADPPPAGGPPPGTPPGGGGQPTGVPALTEFAWRHNLVRPVQGRTFAGVCGAFGRATGTDPVLWRVVLVVLTLFGGIGVLIYLLAWLLLPADGDTGTPIEALGGRGRSRTSTVRTIVGLVIVAIALAGYFSEPYRATPLIGLLILGGVLLLLLRDRSRTGDPTQTVPPPPPYAPPGRAFAPPPHAFPAVGAPQAPYGPPPMPPRTGVAWSPRPAVPRRPPSRLGGITISVAAISLGGLGAADLAGVAVPTLAYIATPLAVIGTGLVVGAWVGRARWLIPLGIALSLTVGGGWIAIEAGQWTRPSVGAVEYTPTGTADIRETYHRNFGQIDLDLSDVDFTGHDVTTSVRVDFGSVTVTLPSDVDVVVDATVGTGDSKVLGQSWSGVGNESRSITDDGSDGPGGGRLHLTVSVGMGSVEVTR